MAARGEADVPEPDLCLFEEVPAGEVRRRIEVITTSLLAGLGVWKFDKLKPMARGGAAVRYSGKSARLVREVRRGAAISFGQRHRSARTSDKSSKFTQLWAIMSSVYEHLATDRVCSQRELYYMNVTLFQSQKEANDAIRDIVLLLQVPRHCLGVFAFARGRVGGDLWVRDGTPDFVHLASAGPRDIPGDLVRRDITFKTNAQYILVVEKDCIFRRIIDDNLAASIPCIIITGLGVPTEATRLLVSRLETEFRIPVIGLVDMNPYGAGLLLTYKIGSAAYAAQGGSYTADVKWAGLRGCDAHLIPEVARLPLSPADVDKAHQLLASDFMRATPEYAAEITGMLDRGWKAELEALHAHGLGYITTNFIPQKILNKEYI